MFALLHALYCMHSSKRHLGFPGEIFHPGMVAHENNDFFYPTRITCYTVVVIECAVPYSAKSEALNLCGSASKNTSLNNFCATCIWSMTYVVSSVS